MVVSYELPDHFLTLPTTGLHITVEEKLAEMVPCKCPDGSSAIRLGQAFLEDGEASTIFKLTVDGEVAVKISFEQDLMR